MKTTQTILDEILVDVRKELAEAQHLRPLAELRRRIVDVSPVRSMSAALRSSFGLIAEIKERSPSHGPMRRQNIDAGQGAGNVRRSRRLRHRQNAPADGPGPANQQFIIRHDRLALSKTLNSACGQ